MHRGSCAEKASSDTATKGTEQHPHHRPIHHSVSLRVNDIRRSAPCRILEEQFNFPAAFVEIADGGSGQGELVGEKDKALAGVGVAEADSAQMVWIVVAAVIAVESDGLVGEDARLLVRRAGVDARCVEVALGASDKKCSGQMDAMKPAIVEVAAIHHIVGSGLENYLVEDFDVVRISSGDADKHGNRSAQIEQRMHFDGGLGGTKMRPGEQTQ